MRWPCGCFPWLPDPCSPHLAACSEMPGAVLLRWDKSLESIGWRTAALAAVSRLNQADPHVTDGHNTGQCSEAFVAVIGSLLCFSSGTPGVGLLIVLVKKTSTLKRKTNLDISASTYSRKICKGELPPERASALRGGWTLLRSRPV